MTTFITHIHDSARITRRVLPDARHMTDDELHAASDDVDDCLAAATSALAAKLRDTPSERFTDGARLAYAEEIAAKLRQSVYSPDDLTTDSCLGSDVDAFHVFEEQLRTQPNGPHTARVEGALHWVLIAAAEKIGAAVDSARSGDLTAAHVAACNSDALLYYTHKHAAVLPDTSCIHGHLHRCDDLIAVGNDVILSRADHT